MTKTTEEESARTEFDHLETQEDRKSGIAGKMADIYSDLKNPKPKGWNAGQKFEFVTFSQITDPVRKACAKHGVAFCPTVLESRSEPYKSPRGAEGFKCYVLMEFRWIDGDSGSELVVRFPGESVDYGDKGLNKAMTTATKQCLMKVLLLGSGEDDPDAWAPQDASSDSQSAPGKTLDKWNAQNKRFRALTGGGRVAPEAMKRMVGGVKSFSEIGVGDLLAFNDRLAAIPEDERPDKVRDWLNKWASDLLAEEEGKADE